MLNSIQSLLHFFEILFLKFCFQIPRGYSGEQSPRKVIVKGKYNFREKNGLKFYAQIHVYFALVYFLNVICIHF
jgi:hypothetical protein